MAVKKFSTRVLEWFDVHGRKTLPWQQEVNPYRVWISEIMLQQTQVTTVIPYFKTFMSRFPDVSELAKADQDDVLALWSGLGYYARARNLHKAAIQVVNEYDGQFPETRDELNSLTGIGRSTAAAILALSHGRKEAILDGNVKRVLCRHKGIEGWPGHAGIQSQLWQIAEVLLPEKNLREYTQAMMDIGATVCTRTNPGCLRCPVREDCIAKRQGTQHLLPTPGPKKEKPEKSRVFLILKDRQSRILLQKRAPTGIWGGLWSLPECEPEDDYIVWCKKNLGQVVKNKKCLNKFKHIFTHFTLNIQPVLLNITTNVQQIKEDDMQWFSVEDALKLGLPAPVTTLLKGLL